MSERNRTSAESTRGQAVPVSGSAPGRVNLIGEHVDYNGGRCLPFALAQRTVARLLPRDDEELHLRSGEERWSGHTGLQPGEVDGWAAYVAGVFWALGVRDGFDIEISSDVPVGAGLSSSAALEGAVAVALDASLGLGLDHRTLIDACVRAEKVMVGAPTGGLDQEIAFAGRVDQALLVDFATDPPADELVAFAPGAAGLATLVIDTRVKHTHVGGGYGDRRGECDRAADLVSELRGARVTLSEATEEEIERLPEPLDRRARHVLAENARVDACVAALRAGAWGEVGPLLDASHVSLRDDFEVSCAELDVAVEIAREAGAQGARMTGGGFGGSAIALVPHARVEAVRRAVTVAFAAQGWAEPAYLDAQAGPGAHAQAD